MRRIILLLVLVMTVLLLSACAGISITYKDARAASENGQADTAQDNGQTSEPGDGTDYGKPAVNEGNAASVTGAHSMRDNGTHKPKDTTEPAPEAENRQPPLLTEMVEKAGLSFDDITFSQLVLVAAEGATADIYCYDKNDDGLWELYDNTGHIKGYVGRNGVSTDKREGDGRAPAGLFSLGYAFGNNAKPETGMMWQEVTKDTYWVDDPDSKYYNQWVEGTADADWDSAEHLSASPKSYAYAVVVEYNTENTVPGKGSAVFLHCKNEPTSGCVAAPQEEILRILKWLSEDRNPGMLIVAR